jgi:sugar/nucleoside kinase (ribokinase family)
MPKAEHDYVVIGHVTVDVDAATGARKPGGTALYSGLQAARLGWRTLVVTAGEPDELGELLAPFAGEFELLVQARESTTTFVTSGSGPRRSQRRVGWAGAIADPGPIDARIVHIAPVARETGAITAAPGSFVGVTPQGLIRSWDATGAPGFVALDPALMPARYDALVLDEVERTFCEPAVSAAARAGVTVAVTAAERGVTLLGPDVQLPALEPTALIEDLGAGDVFSAAFFIALNEGLDQLGAARFGQAAACLRLGGAGAAAVAGREAIASAGGGASGS